MPLRKFREASYIIHIPVWEVGGRTDELENCGEPPRVDPQDSLPYHDRVWVSGGNYCVRKVDYLSQSDTHIALLTLARST